MSSFREIFTSKAQAMRQMSFGGPEVRDGVCLEEDFAVELHECLAEEETSTEENDEAMVSKDVASGRLTVADRQLKTVPFGIIDRHWHWVTTLDVGGNKIEDIDFIVYFELLDTLVLDHNLVHSFTRLPLAPRLHTLWINFNQIHTIQPFVGNLARAFPNLRYLSMMGNPAAPGFVNGGSFHDYIVYRLFVLSIVRSLSYLDDRLVDEDEKKDAREMFAGSNYDDVDGAGSRERQPVQERIKERLTSWWQEAKRIGDRRTLRG